MLFSIRQLTDYSLFLGKEKEPRLKTGGVRLFYIWGLYLEDMGTKLFELRSVNKG